MSKSPFIFISYRRVDSNDVTGRIYDRLVNTFGRDSVFKDVNSIPLGVIRGDSSKLPIGCDRKHSFRHPVQK